MRRTSTPTRFLVLFLALAMIFGITVLPKSASAQSIGITVSFGPPPIPYYVQPPAPYPDWVWSPGYWAYGPYGYYWVPGTWVPAPEVGLYWTPGYWAFNGVAFVFSSGYWAPEVGWYGGVDYGYGYYGNGYYGGRWRGRHFDYNTAITNVNRTYITTVYNDPRVVEHTWNRVSYNGGRGGIMARPAPNQLAVASHRFSGPTNVQMQHARFAATNRAAFYPVNHGRPAQAAVARPYSSAYRPAAQHVAAPMQHAYSPQRMAAPHMAAPMQHAYMPQQHYAAPQARHYAAPQAQRYAAPQAQRHYAAPQAQHYAAPQVQRHYAAPQARYYAAPQQPHYAAPQMQRAAPQGRPAPGGGGGGGGGGGRHDNGHGH